MKKDESILGEGNEEVDELIKKANSTKEEEDFDPAKNIRLNLNDILGRWNTMFEREEPEEVKEIDYAKASSAGTVLISALKRIHPDESLGFMIVALKGALGTIESAYAIEGIQKAQDKMSSFIKRDLF